jgi:two-component system alkaline phosphatase synthesis response regulator PhoP
MSSSPHHRVLIIDDEAVIRDLVCLQLGLSGYDCVAVPDGLTGLQLTRTELFDLIVLDLSLPGLDGITVCETIRRDTDHSDTPILILTARREETDKVLGLQSGADDYLTKPFSMRELIARAGALTRRFRARPMPAASTRPVISVAGLSIDPDRHQVTVNGTRVDLTPQEFSLVYTLASRPGIVFNRDVLLTKVWRGEAIVGERSVDELVKRVRHKIERHAGGRRHIATVWGTGYKFIDE